MMSLLIRKKRNRVIAMAVHIDEERRLLYRLTQQSRAQLGDRLRGEWGIAGCFAAGFLTGRYGSKMLKPLRAIPFWNLFQKVRPYLHLPF